MRTNIEKVSVGDLPSLKQNLKLMFCRLFSSSQLKNNALSKHFVKHVVHGTTVGADAETGYRKGEKNVRCDLTPGWEELPVKDV
ncbi:hypothetical protein TNCV_1816021 [Trichonephila clavipes]|nr:hypothetical protein TNCV_1816021 [Trichonephila clavipes]